MDMLQLNCHIWGKYQRDCTLLTTTTGKTEGIYKSRGLHKAFIRVEYHFLKSNISPKLVKSLISGSAEYSKLIHQSTLRE